MSEAGGTDSRERGGRAVVAVVLALSLGGSFLLRLHHLGDDPLERWDESFHAVVARNLVAHPLKPTLIDVPYLPYDYADWHENHVWLHKPILPLWQIAASFSLFGVSRLTLRLPSLLLGTACVWLTYAIGRRLADRRAGAAAAVLQALSPVMVQLIHGRWFADHVDVSLLFWTELGVLFVLRTVETGRWRDVAVAGVATGCAYLSKSYLAAIVPGLALAAWLLPRTVARQEVPSRMLLRHVLGLFGIACAVIAPWSLYAFVNYRNEFLYEHAAWWRHLAGKWEDWGAPWERVVFDYLPGLHHVFFTPLLVAAFALTVSAIRERSFGLWFAIAWILGVFVPHFIAPTKTPTATLIAMPPLQILFGALVSRAWRGDLWSQAAWFAVAAGVALFPGEIRPPNRGYALDPGLPSIFAKAPWVAWHVVATALVMPLVIFVGRLLERSEARSRACLVFRTGLVAVAVVATLWLALQLGWTSLKVVTRLDRLGPGWVAGDGFDLGVMARTRLPPNAVLVFESDDHPVPAMFHADRTCYGLRGRDLGAIGAEIRRNGGEPYLVAPSGGSAQAAGKRALFEDRAGNAVYGIE